VVLIPDGGNYNNIVYTEKGIIHLHAQFDGKSCHASRPWLGENAIENMLRFYSLIKNYIQDDKKLLLGDHWGSSVSFTVVNG
jgi:acetylornithine deacetylase/succinyl-diaminopimelate desuccinylase-like protein